MMKQNALEVVYTSNGSYQTFRVSLFVAGQKSGYGGNSSSYFKHGNFQGEPGPPAEAGRIYEADCDFVEIEALEGRFDHPVDTGGYDISIMLRAGAKAARSGSSVVSGL